MKRFTVVMEEHPKLTIHGNGLPSFARKEYVLSEERQLLWDTVKTHVVPAAVWIRDNLKPVNTPRYVSSWLCEFLSRDVGGDTLTNGHVVAAVLMNEFPVRIITHEIDIQIGCSKRGIDRVMKEREADIAVMRGEE